MTHNNQTDEVADLHARIAELERQNQDLEIALRTAIEHGDAMEADLRAVNDHLRAEIAERDRAEARLRGLVEAITSQKNDLELLVEAITQHSDELDLAWVERLAVAEGEACTDALTGLANRRRLIEGMECEWARARRETTPLSVILFDVDHFKLFNDCYGHVAGDECLRRVAGAVSEMAKRSTDLVARYGGEEFVVLLPDTPHEPALRMAESIRAHICALGIPHETSPTDRNVSASFGVVTCRPAVECSPVTLLDCVDRMLYRAKASGRNRVESMCSTK